MKHMRRGHNGFKAPGDAWANAGPGRAKDVTVSMKAIIMAGGEGTRLRPLTCDCPKPMIRLMNRPVLQYALTLLKAHGIADVAATLGYLPDAIRDAFGAGDACGVSLRYTVERVPLGTAGGVRQAAGFLDETFVVLSGDGVTDLDLTDAVAFHRRKGALATLVLKRTDNPLDYGVVLTDPDGRVRAFYEKPDWSDVVSDTVNTGIYILEPEVLSMIPGDRPCDFGRDLFPELVRRDLPVYGYVMKGYWCDIGDVRAYLTAHADAMEGRIRLEGLIPRGGRTIQMPGASVDRSAVLEGPCLIGSNVRVLAGAYVGPYSVLGEGCVVGEGASVKRSVLWPGSRLERGAQARGCVLGVRAVLGEGAQAYEESVLGTGAVLGSRGVLLPGVKLWPGKRGADGERLDANLVWGGERGSGFVAGTMAISAPAPAVRATQALCAAMKPRRLLLGRAPDAAAGALWHACAAGAMAQGAQVLDAGVCPVNLLRYAQRLLRCDCAALVTRDGLMPLNARGARLSTREQRSVSAQNARQDYPPPFCGETAAVESAVGLRAAYVSETAAVYAADPKAAPPVALFAEDESLQALANDVFRRAGLFARAGTAAGDVAPGEVGVCLDERGEGCSLADERGMLSEGEQQLLLAWTLLEAGERLLLLPTQATRAIQRLAEEKGAQVEYVAGESALWMNALAERCPNQLPLHLDGICTALAMLNALAGARLSLEDWRRAMPAVSRRTRSIPVPASQTGRVLRAMARRERRAELGGGMRFSRKDGWAWIGPDERRPEFRIVAEAINEETAKELCDFCEGELKRLTGTRN